MPRLLTAPLATAVVAEKQPQTMLMPELTVNVRFVKLTALGTWRMVDQLLNVLQPLKAFLSGPVDALPEETCDGCMPTTLSHQQSSILKDFSKFKISERVATRRLSGLTFFRGTFAGQ